MNLFVSAELNQTQQVLLLANLPAGFKTVFAAEMQEKEVLVALRQAEIIFGNPPVQWLAGPLPALQFWQLDSTGFHQYKDLDLSCTVANMGDFYAQACAETMVAGLLAFYRGIPTLVKLQEQKQWKGKLLRPNLELLSGKKVLVLGAGSIAQAIKKMLLGFGCQVWLSGRQNPAADLLSYEAILEQLPMVQIVINTLPGHLVHFVSADFFANMADGSLYASVGRGSTTDEAALITALQNQKLAGAVLDVTEQEPLPAFSPLWDLENVLLTQHTGGGQVLETEGKINRFLRNLDLFLAAKPVPDKVNLTQGY
ncbi:D-2-hydroxyacid dehydrogenase [Rufibacter sp. LB8]|uniref:D-2-hydroxyacid dehydrogenase n=1 Tax=Rufibacter sp. LB8 TaxID=2777781 RepID=UPI00178C7008|nr:D-2-hydroxyacid dehydrogenase [Rufibacter sp. LB8]